MHEEPKGRDVKEVDLKLKEEMQAKFERAYGKTESNNKDELGILFFELLL